MQTTTKLVEQFCDGPRLLILCGAGVSMVEPTRLPSGLELLVATLKEVVRDGDLSEAFGALLEDERFQDVVPETIFQQVLDVCGSLPRSPFDGLRSAPPNHVHHWIAGLAKDRGAKVATTNFDRLLTQSGTPEVCHLHGSIDEFESMTTTIRRVGSGMTTQVADEFAVALDWADRILVLGYSGNDRDVMSVLEDRAPAEVMWVVRGLSSDVPKHAAKLAKLARFVVAPVDLSMLGDPQWADRTARPALEATIGQTFEASSAEQLEVIAACLQQVERFADSVRLLADRWESSKYGSGAGGLAVRLAHAYNVEDHQHSAASTATRALELGAWEPSVVVRLHTEVALACMDSEPPQLEDARTQLNKATSFLSACDEVENDLLAARLLHNSAYLETMDFITSGGGDLDIAERKYQEAVELKRLSGDLIYLQASLRNLAGLLICRGAEDAASIQAEFIAIAERYGLVWSRAYLPSLVGSLLLAHGRQDEAECFLVEAKRLYEEIGDQAMLRKIERMLSTGQPL